MNEKLKQLAIQSGTTHKQNLGVYQFYDDELEKFAELILQSASDHIMESSDRYRKEYFAEKVLKTFDGDGEYEIGTMEGLKEFEEKRNASKD